MLEPLLGSTTREQVLMLIYASGGAHPTEIARTFSTAVAAVQEQAERLEAGGVLVSRLVGRTRLYEFNPRYPFLKELKELLEKCLSFYPENERERLLMVRRRPRRRGKPL